MLRFDVLLCHIGINAAHKVRRYIHSFVALDLVPNVKWLTPDIAYILRTNSRPIRLRRISTPPPASWRVSSRGPLRRIPPYLHPGFMENIDVAAL